MNDLQRHPLGTFLPSHKPSEEAELEESVKTLGLTRPIILYENKVLDGWLVYGFAKKHNKTLRFEQFTNTVVSALDYRVSTIKGRSLTLGQKAAVAVAYKRKIKEQNYRAVIHNQATPKDKLIGNDKAVVKARLSSTITGKLFGISANAVDRADYVEKRNRDLFNKVEKGEIPLGRAWKLAGGKRDHIDQQARKIIQEAALTDFQPPKSIYEEDSKFWTMDADMKRKGFNLCLTRIGDTWDAVYTKGEKKASVGHVSWKSALLLARNLAIELVKQPA